MSLESDIRLLGRVELFAGFPDDHLRLIAFSAVRRDVAAGGRLFRKGDKGRAAFVVAAGSIELSTGSGRERRVQEVCPPGTLIGEAAMFCEIGRGYDATATEVSEVLEISRELMQRLLQEYPDVAERLQQRLARRLSGTLNDLQRVRQRLLVLGD